MRNGEIQQIRKYVSESKEDLTPVELVDRYFTENVVWSKEKDEWAAMTTEQKQAFVITLTETETMQTQTSTPAKRVAQIKAIASKQKIVNKEKVIKVPAPVKAKTKTKVVAKAPVKVVKAPPMEGGKVTKMSKARVIYKAMKNKPRQDILAAFIKMGLTKAGANTYLQIIRKG